MADDSKAIIELVLETRDSLAKLKQLEVQFRTSLRAMDAAVKAGLDPASAEFRELQQRVEASGRELVATGRAGETAMRKIASATGSGTKEVDALGKELSGLKTDLKDVEIGGSSGVAQLTAGFTKVHLAILAAASALAAMGIQDFIKDSFDASLALDRIATQLHAISGSAEAGGESMEFVREEADRLGLPIVQLAETFARLSAATKGTNLEGQATRDIFSSVSEAARVMNLTAAQTELSLNAVQQMISKGTVSAEELRQQLGDHLPGAFQIAARAMGVTTAELNDMLRAGAVAADEFLPRFGAELQRTFGEGLATAVDSAQAKLQRFENAIFSLKASFGEGFLDEVAGGAGDVGEAMQQAAVAAAAMGRGLGVLVGIAGKVVAAWNEVGGIITGIFGNMVNGASGVVTAFTKVAEFGSKLPGGSFLGPVAEQAREAARDLRILGASLLEVARERFEWDEKLVESVERQIAAFPPLVEEQEKATAAAKRQAAAQRDTAAAIRDATAAAAEAVAKGPDRDVFGRELDPKAAQQSVDALKKRKAALEAETASGAASLETWEELARVKTELTTAEGKLNQALNSGIGEWKGAESAIHGYEVAIADAGQSLSDALPGFDALDENVRRNAGSVENLFGATAKLVPQIEEGAKVTTRMAGGLAEGARNAESAGKAIAGLAAGQDEFNKRAFVTEEATKAAAEGTEKLGQEAKTADDRLAALEKTVEAIKKTLEGTYSETMLAGQKAHNVELDKTVTLYLAWEACLKRMGELAA